VLWANEKDHFAEKTFRLNFPKLNYLRKPIEELTVEGDSLETVDILTAGFPCQPFSVAGEKKGFLDKERGELFLHIIRIIRELGIQKPKILLLENVRNFRTHDEGRTFARVQREIQNAGYWFSDKDAQILNTMTHTDIPQNRGRVFMIAFSRDHFSGNTFEFPKPLPAGSLRPVREFLTLNKKPPESFYFRNSQRYYPLFVEAMAKGDPKAIYQLRRNYVRENMSGVCFTLMANMGDGGHNHPVIKDRWGIRKLTPRECARLQGYEDDWFQIPPELSRGQISKQIGNSVTIPLIEKLAAECIRHIELERRMRRAAA
jgi:DNA (cytosine-5)-methyltransferase 1